MAKKDSFVRTLGVAVLLCAVCSIFVSTAAVALRETQDRNRLLDRKRNILDAGGLLEEDTDVEAAFEKVVVQLVDLATGEVVETGEAASEYDPRQEANNPAESVEIPDELDTGGIGRRAKKARVYRVEEGGELRLLILPVSGKGLWGTMYAFLALDADLETVSGLSFYEHVETPGLGGEVDNPSWKEQWEGRKLYDESGDVVIEVVKAGQYSDSSPNAEHQVDGLSGATITTRGVTNLLRYWLGEHGYGPYLDRLEKKK